MLSQSQGFQGQATVSPSTHTVIRPQLRGAVQSYSYGIIEGRWGRESDKLLRQISESGIPNRLSRVLHERSYVISSGRSTAGKSGHLYVLETFRKNENTIVDVTVKNSLYWVLNMSYARFMERKIWNS